MPPPMSLVPACGERCRVQPGGFPQPLFQRIGAASIAARDERGFCRGNRLQRGDGVVRPSDLRRVSPGPDDNKIVPGDLGSGDAVARFHEGGLGVGVMDQH